MPYTIRKVRGKPCYKVMNKKSGRVSAKCTELANAKKQLRLLNAIEFNKNFTPNNRSKSNSRKSRKSRG